MYPNLRRPRDSNKIDPIPSPLQRQQGALQDSASTAITRRRAQLYVGLPASLQQMTELNAAVNTHNQNATAAATAAMFPTDATTPSPQAELASPALNEVALSEDSSLQQQQQQLENLTNTAAQDQMPAYNNTVLPEAAATAAPITPSPEVANAQIPVATLNPTTTPALAPATTPPLPLQPGQTPYATPMHPPVPATVPLTPQNPPALSSNIIPPRVAPLTAPSATPLQNQVPHVAPTGIIPGVFTGHENTGGTLPPAYDAAIPSAAVPTIPNAAPGQSLAQSPSRPRPAPKHAKSHDANPTKTAATGPASCESNSLVGKLTCRLSSNANDHPTVFFTLLVALVLLCLCRRRLFGHTGQQDATAARGQYRAVADHYADIAFDDTFEDDFSAGDENEDYMSDDDDEEGWSNGGKQVIEMKSLGTDEPNGGLTLEEMNG